MKGYVQVYTGSGKGKTTAAIGLAIRALGAGWRVFFAQFLKGEKSSEYRMLPKCSDQLLLKCYGRPGLIRGEPGEEDRRLAQQGIHEVARVAASGDYQLVILDEANVAVHYGLVSVDQLLHLIDRRADGVELLFTGRHAHPRLVARADLVTDMQEVKHYYHQGVPARMGVEI